MQFKTVKQGSPNSYFSSAISAINQVLPCQDTRSTYSTGVFTPAGSLRKSDYRGHTEEACVPNFPVCVPPLIGVRTAAEWGRPQISDQCECNLSKPSCFKQRQNISLSHDKFLWRLETLPKGLTRIFKEMSCWYTAYNSKMYMYFSFRPKKE